MENEENIIKEIREKIKKLKTYGRDYVHPCNREFQEDMKKYGFENGNKFICWMQNNGILINSIIVHRRRMIHSPKILDIIVMQNIV